VLKNGLQVAEGITAGADIVDLALLAFHIKGSQHRSYSFNADPFPLPPIAPAALRVIVEFPDGQDPSHQRPHRYS